MEKKNECIHSGHRKRLMELAYRSEFENLTIIQQVELVLCYVFPRGDVNPLAHRLLDRYKKLRHILEAPIEDLQQVEGMGYLSALKLHNILGIFQAYVMEKARKEVNPSSIGEIYDYIEDLLRFKTKEEVHLIGLDSKGQLCAERCLSRGKHSIVWVNLRDISFFVSTYDLPAVILVHNHPDGLSTPSAQDYFSHDKLQGLFQFSGCRLNDDLIVGTDGIYSIMQDRLMRAFVNSDAYEEAISQLNTLANQDEANE